MEQSIGREYMKQSTCANCGDCARDKKLIPPPLQLPYAEDSSIIKLPEPDMLADQEINFLELIELRTSVRQYHETPLTLAELSYLLWCTQGVKMAMPQGTSIRNVPSAGARHALETYLYINRVDGVSPGLYRFLALEHALLLVQSGEELNAVMVPAFKNQKMVKTCAVTFIWLAVLERMAYAYGQRAYRYIHLDAGHVCQNLYLAARTINSGVCAIGAFDDERLNAVLGVDGESQFAIYAATVGK